MVVSVNAPKAVEEEEPIVEEGAEGEDGTEDAAEGSSDDTTSDDAESEGSEES